jgi:hypothetical protein
MAQLTKESVSRHVQSECDALNKGQGLPFRELLTEDRIVVAMERAEVQFRDRIYTPMVTLWAFLSQSVASTASSCENAVSRVLADRVACRKSACSTDTNSYCQARARLPARVLVELTQETGQTLHQQAAEEWLWKGRRVHIVDGSTATMPDTPENQKEYPQSRGQKPGLGFPIVRMVVLLSLSVGAVLDCAVGPCRGKCTGEQSLFRRLWKTLKPGEIVLADRLFDAYRDIALLRKRGVDSLFGKKQSRSVDFRCGRRLAPNDHIVTWKRPQYDKNRFESKRVWKSLPKEMEIREVRVTVRRKGCRTRSVVIVTTLLDATVYSSDDLTNLFAERWHCELDLRSIKQSLGMHHLRCKTPEMIRKELWAHLLAYNLIRVRMAQAAAVSGVLPRRFSFTAAKNHLHNFTVHLQAAATVQEYQRLETEMLKAIAQCQVGNRPGRKEPRALKRRVQKYSYLTKPRNEARKGLPA